MRKQEKYKFVEFQMHCNKCFEILYQDTFMITADESGKMPDKEAERVFGYSYFTDIKRCWCCGSKDFGRNYACEVADNEPITDNLPF